MRGITFPGTVIPLALVLLLAVFGCSVPTNAAPRVVVVPSIAESAVAALALWSDASEDAFAPEIVVSDDCDGATWCFVGVESLAGCGDSGDAFACTNARTWLVSDLTGVSPGGMTRLDTSRTPQRWWVSTLAHEIGHQLGLSHSDSRGVMDPLRSDATRERPCVDAATLAAAGLSGAGACLE